ncbi:DUF5689 domain-containing protein [Flavobacteriaceae bacterium F08102]|nr:DUF5689 domain-containing protein [Flavobacteriaceae bacterium F08102]
MKRKTRLIFFITSLLFLACIQDDDYSIPPIVCDDPNLSSTTSIQEVFDQSTLEPTSYLSPDIITAYVISDDQTGNFYKILYLQETGGERGLSIPIDENHIYTIYNPGRKVYIKLENTHTQIKDDGLIIGNLVDQQIGRLAKSNYKNIVIQSCESITTAELFKTLSLNELNDSHINTLVTLRDVQFEQLAVGKTLYDNTNDAGGGTNYNIIDISGAQIRVRTSAFADFGGALVPEGNGTISGVLTKFGIHYQLLPRSILDFQMPNDRKRIGFAATISGTKTRIKNVRNFFKGKDVRYPDDHFIEGIITMSGIDQNNLSNRTVFLQDESGGIALRFSHITTLIRGQKIRVQLKDAVLNNNRGLLQINRVQWEDVFFVAENIPLPTPAKTTIEHVLNGAYQGQLVYIENVQFEQTSGTFKGQQRLEDCDDNIPLITLNSAHFFDEETPIGNGPLTAIVSALDEPVLIIRDLNDVKALNNARCIPKGDLSQQLFFSEFADPDNNAHARFLELYNASNQSLDLTGWLIKRYTNANTESTAQIDLTGHEIGSKQTFVIAINEEVFEQVYGKKPDLIGAANGPAGSNGDDTMVLIDPEGTIIDVFGRIGEDGSNTDHEFEDGKAIRLANIQLGNPIFTPSEWLIYNDTGAHETIKKPQSAPADFTPGIR